MTRPRRIGTPLPVRVRAPEDGDANRGALAPGTPAHGTPVEVDGTPVDSVREQWVVEDRWWTPKPLRRRYFELVLDDGRNVVVFRDLRSRRWFSQRS